MSSRLGGFIAGQNINVSIGTFTAVTSPTFTFASTQATPAVGQAVQFTTTATLPTGLSTGTTYYVISTSTNTCQFSTTLGGSAVTFTNSTGSGTHTAVTQRAFNVYAGAPDTVEYLVVAGGGAGGGDSGTASGNGGGGAGGLLTASNYAVATGTALTITVGAGGAGAPTAIAINGSNSVFGNITATGGGGGAYYSNGIGGTGGSGGGGGADSGAGGAGTSGQGNAGGRGNTSSGGGGGGAGSPPVQGIGGVRGGGGGTGLCSTITGTRVFYAGGGGGSSGYVEGAGGAGGGGTGANTTTKFGVSGTANTGGGGGGQTNGSSSPSGSGGSGIVIIRYPQINSAPALVTGSPQVSYSDGYQIYTWTSSGSIIF